MSRWIEDGTIDIFRLMKKSKVDKLEKIMRANEDLSLTELMPKLPVKASYGELRWIKSHINFTKK